MMLKLLLLTAFAGIASHAQTFTNLVEFDLTNGAVPLYESLVQSANGNFYGTTSEVGTSHLGTIFTMTPQGHLKTLHVFRNVDGAYPWAGVMVAQDGMLYGSVVPHTRILGSGRHQ